MTHFLALSWKPKITFRYDVVQFVLDKNAQVDNYCASSPRRTVSIVISLDQDFDSEQATLCSYLKRRESDKYKILDLTGGHAITTRDRPFNLKGGLLRSEFVFRTTQEFKYLFFLWRKARIFSPEFNIRLYDKNSESDYLFFLPPKSEYFFQRHWESEYFFFQKKTITPLQVKWSFPYTIYQLRNLPLQYQWFKLIERKQDLWNMFAIIVHCLSTCVNVIHCNVMRKCFLQNNMCQKKQEYIPSLLFMLLNLQFWSANHCLYFSLSPLHSDDLYDLWLPLWYFHAFLWHTYMTPKLQNLEN